MRIKLIVVAILFLIFAIIASQNTITTPLFFLFWSAEAPLIVMITVIFILGLITGIVFCGTYERKKRKEASIIPKKTDEKEDLSNKNPMK